FAGMVAVAFALAMALGAMEGRRVNAKEIGFAATVVPADTTVTIEGGKVAPWRAMVSWPGVVLAVVGLGSLGAAGVRARGETERLQAGGLRERGLRAAGEVLVCAGVLAQRMGAVGFYLVVAGAVLVCVVLPGIGRAWRGWRG